jgi:hypothetical protein
MKYLNEIEKRGSKNRDVQYLLSIIKSQQYALNAFEKYSMMDKIKESGKSE